MNFRVIRTIQLGRIVCPAVERKVLKHPQSRYELIERWQK